MKPKKIHMDFETFSACDIKTSGAYRYAADSSTRLLCCAFAFDDGEPVVWHPTMENPEIIEPYFEALRDPSVLILAHNCMFERAIFEYVAAKVWGIPFPAVSRFHCTMSLARRAALPAKLETLALTLGLANLKDNRGKALIKKFSMLQPAKKATKLKPALPVRRIRPEDEPEAFAEFCAYCAQDVRAEQEVARKLAYFDEPINNANYSLDAVINARGVPVNLTALKHAQRLIEEETEIVSAKFRELTGFEVTQNAVFLKWLNDGGCALENLQAETIETYLEENYFPNIFEPPTIAALRMKQSIAYASIKKVATMLACAGPGDNRIRGLLTHHGAGTGRWTASLVQPQNFKRSTEESESAYKMICAGESREALEICYGPVLEIISCAIRHFFQDLPNEILDGDYAGIEARVINWLADQEDSLEVFRAYDRAPTGSDEKKALDPYRIMAAEVYQIPVSEVKKFPHRFVGKGLELGAGFMLSPGGYRRQCLDQAGYDLPEGQEYHAIGLWRKKHAKVVKWWKELDRAGKQAIAQIGKVFTAGKIKFCCKVIEGTKFLLMRLPSGRKISYPRPKIVPGKFEGTTQIAYYGNIKGAKWGDCRLWPGVMANNATQGTAADIMANGAANCERAGYAIFNIIHDQALAFHGEGQTVEEFVRLLTTLPKWAAGLPIAAEGALVPFYKKD